MISRSSGRSMKRSKLNIHLSSFSYSMIQGKNQIIESICPYIYERYPEKLGLLLAIIGGVPKSSGEDPRIRGQIHMLMIGEPGTGKS
jgi:DNA helicase MCM9